MYYIENNDKPRFLESMFKIIKIEGNKLILPLKTKNINKKYLAKLARKTKKILDKTKSKKIVLSKILKENEEYKNILYTYGFDIVDGKWLFEVISCEVLDYIVNLKNIKKEDTEISILVNYITQNTLENIKKIARQYKRLNIVTNHIEKFKKIEEELYNKEGIMIIVTNNKKKSLSKSKIILNIDFSEEQLKKYKMNIASNELRNSKRKINDIALSLGYSNASKFSIAFQSVYGILPKDYRKAEN